MPDVSPFSLFSIDIASFSLFIIFQMPPLMLSLFSRLRHAYLRYAAAGAAIIDFSLSLFADDAFFHFLRCQRLPFIASFFADITFSIDAAITPLPPLFRVFDIIAGFSPFPCCYFDDYDYAIIFRLCQLTPLFSPFTPLRFRHYAC